MKLPACCGPKVLLALALLFVALLIVSFVLAFKVFPDIIEDEINKSVRLEKGTDQFDRFEELPFPMTFKVYVWTVQNPDEILNGGKPKMKEVGPYVYKEYLKKNITEIDGEDDTVTYTQSLRFEFDPEASGDLREEDRLMVVNPPYNSMLQIAEDLPTILGAIGDCIENLYPPEYNSLFINATVKEILFHGLIFCEMVPADGCGVSTIACSTAARKRNVDSLHDNPTQGLSFTYFNYRVRSPDGVYKVKRGMKDVDSLGEIVSLDDSSFTAIWGLKGTNLTCDEVTGRDSTIYPPHIDEDSTFTIYSTDICRTLDIKYFGEGTHKGIHGLKYGPTEDSLRYQTATPEEDCFCTNMTKGVDGERNCFLDGLVDMQPCIGVPVILSYPHFLWADQKYRDAIDGMSPDVDKHRTYVLLEPNTGTPLEGGKRIQLNAVIRKVADDLHYTPADKIKGTVIPLIWVDEGISLTDKYVDQLNDEYFSKKSLVDGVQWALVGIFSLLSVIFCGLFIKVQFFNN